MVLSPTLGKNARRDAPLSNVKDRRELARLEKSRGIGFEAVVGWVRMSIDSKMLPRGLPDASVGITSL